MPWYWGLWCAALVCSSSSMQCDNNYNISASGACAAREWVGTLCRGVAQLFWSVCLVFHFKATVYNLSLYAKALPCACRLRRLATCQGCLLAGPQASAAVLRCVPMGRARVRVCCRYAVLQGFEVEEAG